MASKRNPERLPRRPAITPQGRENQLIAHAVDLVERRLTEGTASAQETVFYLKLGSTREKLEQQRLEAENELLKARVEALQSASRMEELTREAIEAFRSYSGQTSDEYYDEG